MKPANRLKASRLRKFCELAGGTGHVSAYSPAHERILWRRFSRGLGRAEGPPSTGEHETGNQLTELRQRAGSLPQSIRAGAGRGEIVP